jgi:hypothetical protein
MHRLLGLALVIFLVLPAQAQTAGLWETLRAIAARSGIGIEARLVMDGADQAMAQTVTARLAQGSAITAGTLRIDAAGDDIRLVLPPESNWSHASQQARVAHRGTIDVARSGATSRHDLHDIVVSQVFPGPVRAARISGDIHHTAPEALSLSISGLATSAETWALARLPGLADEHIDLTLAARALSRSSARIDALTLRLSGTEISLQGTIETLPGVFEGLLAGYAPPSRPFRGGSLQADVRGLSAMTARLSRAGALAPDQQFFLQALIALMGAPVGPDHYRATLGFTPDGALTLNGVVLNL